MPQLLIQDETGETSSLPIVAPTVTIGRRRGNGLCLPHLSVSGYHARIFDERGCLIIEDLDSTNGTIVNGEKIKSRVLVHLDDIIIGSYRISYSETSNVKTHLSGAVGQNADTRAAENSTDKNAPIVNPNLRKTHNDAAAIRVASGRKTGSVVTLEKPVTTLGKLDGDMGAISKKPTGYYFLPVSDYGTPMKHNGTGLTPQVEVKLVCGDVIQIGGDYLEFIHPYND